MTRPGIGVVGRRLVQFLLDELLVFVPMLLLAIAVVWLFHPHGPALLTFLKVVLYTMLALDFLGLVFVMVWWPYRHGGQTPAMRWLRLRVQTLEGGHPSLGAFVVRDLLMLVDGFAWGLAGIVVMLVTRRRQRFGDVVARTVVVRVPWRSIDESAGQAAFPGPDGDFGTVAGAQLALDRADVGLDRRQRNHQ
ncbi:RDD family protein [Amycolatopsis mongoliensis]|uniref:RDD family protein n=1 Tax=Amycolatopsis mongoliensis TaxID=715475 RepID=A0A9Y2NGT3_9PSEU|nr:RDD family protein [Amycolatopsis sp. 4-36]WIX98997.1 RDD family protein [Amycolatopsis sp. 4-36]